MNLTVKGSSVSETQTIDSLNYKKSHKDVSSIKIELDSIQTQLFKRGYIENKFFDLTRINDSSFHTTFYLNRKFSHIKIYYKNPKVNSLLKKITTNYTQTSFELKFSEVETALKKINHFISKDGQPFSKLRLANITLDKNNKLTADLITDTQQKQRRIENIILRGYDRFPISYLKNYLKIKKNQVFNLSQIKDKTQRLQNLPFAKEIKSPEVLFSQDSTILYLYIKKAQSNSFDGFLGFGSNEETGKIQFDGYLNLNLTNNLNFGESFKLLYKSDENDQKTFQTNLSLPYLFKSPIGIDLSLNIFKKDSTFSTTNQSLKLHYQINSKHKVYFGIVNEESSNLLSNTTNSGITDYSKNFYSLSYEFSNFKSNTPLFPINTYLYAETNIGNRKDKNTTEKQFTTHLNAYKIFNLNLRNSIYLRFNGAYLNSDSLFQNELLRFGGINSIRGFEENSLFASSFGLINTEYRFQLNNSIYLHTVIDAAHYKNTISQLDENLFAYGFGFGIMTNSGLFRLNYASGKSENQPFKLSNSKVHISLTTIF